MYYLKDKGIMGKVPFRYRDQILQFLFFEFNSHKSSKRWVLLFAVIVISLVFVFTDE
jgi:hypothetical protein